MSASEKAVEDYLVWAVAKRGGATYKFTSPSGTGVADRIVCLPDGTTWFVELKAPRGRLSERQKLFAKDMAALRQRYACLWSKEGVDEWLRSL